MFFGDEALTALPAWGRVVENVKDLEAFFGVNILEFFQVIFEEDIFFVDVCVDEGNFGAVERVGEDGANDLDHGGDTGTASDHGDV